MMEFPLAMLFTPILMSRTLKSIFTDSMFMKVNPSSVGWGDALKYTLALTPSAMVKTYCD